MAYAPGALRTSHVIARKWPGFFLRRWLNFGAANRAFLIHSFNMADVIVTIVTVVTAEQLPHFFLIRTVGGGVQAGSTRHVGHWMAYCTCPRWLWWWRIWQEKPKYSEKTCPSATLSTTNATWLDPGSNSGRRGGKPATNRLSYGHSYPIVLKWKRPWVHYPVTEQHGSGRNISALYSEGLTCKSQSKDWLSWLWLL
jgi:hypothetical protein